MLLQLTPQEKAHYTSEGYRIVGNHSAIKVCHYTKEALRGKDVCYKCQFYGIKSWQCVQMSPTFFCNHKCVFCWRDIKYSWPKWRGPVDEPKDIVDGCIEAQKDILQGFWGSQNAVEERLYEMEHPRHFAISLTGEPTMYPRLHEMVDELHSRNISSFLVTNGTIPEMVEKLLKHQPTQLYLSLYGTTKEMYERNARPINKDAWERLHQSLSMLHKFKRNVLRLTLTKGYNLTDPKGHAEIIKKYRPMYVECKGYMFVGHSRERLERENMPLHEEIRHFADKLAEYSGYKLVDEKHESSVALLMKEDNQERIMVFD